MIWLELFTSLISLVAIYSLSIKSDWGVRWGVLAQISWVYCIYEGGYWGLLPVELTAFAIYLKACLKQMSEKQNA